MADRMRDEPAPDDRPRRNTEQKETGGGTDRSDGGKISIIPAFLSLYATMRKVLLALAVLAVIATFGFVIFRQWRASTTWRLMRLADNEFESGNMGEAKKIYERLISMDANIPSAHFKLGLIRLGEGNSQEAYRELSRAYRLDPNLVAARDKAMGILLEAGRYDSAAMESRQLLTLSPDSVSLRKDLLVALLGLGDRFAALEEANKLMAAAPADPDGYIVAAYLYARMGQSEQAERLVDDASRKCQGGRDPRIATGYFLAMAKEGRKPAEQLKAAIALAAEGYGTHLALGQYYAEVGNRDRARTEFEKAVQAKPGDPRAIFPLAWMMLDERKTDEARRYVDMLLKSAADLWLTSAAQARLSLLEGDFAVAEQSLRAAAANAPPTAGALLILAQAFLHANHLDQAMRHVEKALAADAGFREARILKTVLLLAQERYSDALAECHAAEPQFPGCREFVLLKGIAHAGCDDRENAKVILRQCTARDPGLVPAYVVLGLILTKESAYRNALEEVGKSAALRAGDLSIIRQLSGICRYCSSPRGAYEYCIDIIKAGPEKPATLIALGELYRESGNMAEARRCFSRAADGNARSPIPLCALARLNAEEGSEFAARETLEKAEAIDGNHPLTQLLLGMLSEKRGDATAAQDRYSRVARARSRLLPALYGLAGVYLGGMQGMTELPMGREEILKLGRVLLSAGAPDVAYACAGMLDEMDLVSPDGQKLRAQILLARGDVQRAIGQFLEVLESYPGDHESRLGLARALLVNGEPEAAIKEAKRIPPEQDTDFSARLLLAELYLASGENDRAAELAERLIAANPRAAEARNVRAIACFRMRRAECAEQGLKEAVERSPDDVTYRSYLILQYVREGKRDEARKELDELLRRRGSDGGATEKLFTICRDERAVDEGLEICGSLVRIQGEKPGLMVEMGRLYLVKGEDKNAERSFNKAVFIDPRCFAAYIELGLVAEKSGRPSEAAALYRRVIEIEPGSLFARRMYASALVSGGKKDEAISIYEELLRRYPDSPEVLCALAALYGERKERSREAMKLALRAREIAPRSAGAIDALGWLYVKEGKYPVALPLLEEGARLHPKDPSILYHLGMACYESGNITCARKYLTECLKVGGEFDGAENARRIISGM